MLFNDPWFLFAFLPVTLLATPLLRRRAGTRAVLGFLVLASVFFYSLWIPLYLPLLGALTAINFVFARGIARAREQGQPDRAKLLLAASIVLALLALGYFKYTDFLIGTANSVLGSDIPFQHILLPLGISFFTFQQIAYLVDTSRGEVAPHSFLEYALFVTFFPVLFAGPIVRHREFFPQIQSGRAFAQRGNLIIGLTIFLIGLFKKVGVADHLSPLVARCFAAAAAGEPLGFVEAWTGAGAYSLQLYFDFSGYSDMAIGAARMFGIRLPLNFESPYQATGIIDFWRRWHMTLSRFLRDYLYIPLGGNRRGAFRRYLNLFLTMAIGGLWHGASWNFVLWGCLHGVYLVINHVQRAVWTPLDTWWSRSLSRLLTLVAVIVAFVPFRAPTLEATATMYRGMVNLPTSFAEGDLLVLLWALGFLAALWFVPNTQQIMGWFRPAFDYDRLRLQRDPPLLQAIVDPRWLRWRPRLPAAILVGAGAAVAFLSLNRVTEFLYQAF